MQKSKSQAGTEVEISTNAESHSSSHNNAKPNVGGSLSLFTVAKKQVRQKHLFDEIKAKFQEHKRIQKQIDELKELQNDIIFKCQKMAKEADKISHYLCDIETEILINNNQ